MDKNSALLKSKAKEVGKKELPFNSDDDYAEEKGKVKCFTTYNEASNSGCNFFLFLLLLLLRSSFCAFFQKGNEVLFKTAKRKRRKNR